MYPVVILFTLLCAATLSLWGVDALRVAYYKGPDEDDSNTRACTATELVKIKAAVKEAVTMAEDAADWLGAENSYIWSKLFLPEETEDAGIRAAIKAKFAAVAANIPKDISATLDYDGAPAGQVLIACAINPNGGMVAGTLSKGTREFIDGTKIKLMPTFFTKPTTKDLSPSIKEIISVLQVGKDPVSRNANQASIMLHEFFHSQEIIGAKPAEDHASDSGSAYGFGSAVSLPPAHKIDNADNYMYAGIIGAFVKREAAKAGQDYKDLSCFLSESVIKSTCKTIPKKKVIVTVNPSKTSHEAFKEKPSKKGATKDLKDKFDAMRKPGAGGATAKAPVEGGTQSVADLKKAFEKKPPFRGHTRRLRKSGKHRQQ